ncbi:MAG: tetratricopeptide repeat protein [Spirochaetaceae bacterium]
MSFTLLLLLPGLLFLLVIFFRVVLPLIKTPGWKRAIDDANYHRHRENYEKADSILEKGVNKFTDSPEIYLEYFLYHSDNRNLKHRFEVLLKGWEKTRSPALAFFIGSAYLEDGNLKKAQEFLEMSETRTYMTEKRFPLLAQMYYEKGEYKKAEEEFYRVMLNRETGIEMLEDLSPDELVLLALIKRKKGEDWKKIMEGAPKSGVQVSMTWKDYLKTLTEKTRELSPAQTGIEGDPSSFNKGRKDYYNERIHIVENYLSNG